MSGAVRSLGSLQSLCRIIWDSGFEVRISGFGLGIPEGLNPKP